MENVLALLGVVAFPLLVERLVSRFWTAVILTTVSLSALIHIAGWIGSGYFEPFYGISIPVSLAAFLVWSIVSIWVIRRVRQRDTLVR